MSDSHLVEIGRWARTAVSCRWAKVYSWIGTRTTAGRFPVVGVLASGMVFPLFIPDFDLFDQIIAAITWLYRWMISGILEAVGYFFVVGTGHFLFFENPRHVDPLNAYWERALPIFMVIIVFGLAVWIVQMMLLADDEQADPQRMILRIAKATFLLVVSKDVFALLVASTHLLVRGVYPTDFSMLMMLDLVEVFTSNIVGFGAGISLALFGGFGVFVTGVLFYILLSMRMLLVYITYAAMPVFLGLWTFDVGPLKYGNFLATMVFRATAILLMFGFIIAALLGTGMGLVEDLGATTTDIERTGASEDGTMQYTIDRSAQQGQPSQSPEGSLKAKSRTAFKNYLIMIGCIWIALGLTTRLGQFIFSASASNPGGAGGFTGAPSGAGGRSPPGGAGGMPAANGQQQAYAFQLDDGRTVVTNRAGEGFQLDPGVTGSDSDTDPFASTFGPGDGPVQPVQAPSISEKLDDISGGRLGAIQSRTGNVKNGIEEWAEHRVPERAEDIGQSIGTRLASAGEQHGGAAGAAAGKTAGRAATTAASAIGKAPSVATTAAGLPARTGRAYNRILKQPPVVPTLNEMHRMARESPMGKPNSTLAGEGDQPIRDRSLPHSGSGKATEGSPRIGSSEPEAATVHVDDVDDLISEPEEYVDHDYLSIREFEYRAGDGTSPAKLADPFGDAEIPVNEDSEVIEGAEIPDQTRFGAANLSMTRSQSGGPDPGDEETSYQIDFNAHSVFYPPGDVPEGPN